MFAAEDLRTSSKSLIMRRITPLGSSSCCAMTTATRCGSVGRARQRGETMSELAGSTRRSDAAIVDLAAELRGFLSAIGVSEQTYRRRRPPCPGSLDCSSSTPKPTPSPSPRPRNWTPSPTRSPKPTLPPTLSFSPTFAPSPAPSVSPSAAPSPHPTPQPQTAAPTQKPIPEKFPFYFTVAGVEVMKTQITFLNSLCACVFVGGTLRHLYDSLWRPKMSLVEGGLRSNRRF